MIMKTICIWGFLGAFSILVAGCAGKDARGGSQVSSQPATYTCPSCKESVTWVYGSWPESPKGATTARKVVKHECPSCKKEWSGDLSTTTTCAVCAQEHAACPVCLTHGG